MTLNLVYPLPPPDRGAPGWYSLTESQLYGQGALLPPYKHIFSGITSTPCCLLEFSAARVRELMESDAELGRSMYRSIAIEVLRRFADTVADMRGKQSEQYMAL